MMKVPEQNYTCKHSIVMIIFNYMIRIILSQFKQGCLTYFQKFIIVINFYVILRNPIWLGVEKYETNKNDPKETEGICHEIGEECKSSHLQETLILWLYRSMEQAGPKRHAPRVDGCFELPHLLYSTLYSLCYKLTFKLISLLLFSLGLLYFLLY